jgi:CheY-like chemotaxis protein
VANQQLQLKTEFNFLIVDDSPLSRKMERESIRQECQVIRSNVVIKFSECSDGIEAVNTVTAEGLDAFDEIFIDNIMISMNGAEATRHIRSLGFTGVMVAVSGNVLKDDVDAFFAAGADYFVEKPLQRAVIHKALLQILYSTRQN